MLHYEKRKNNKLFESIQSNSKLEISKIQNFIPIYSKFFSLNELNYNSINLNNSWYVSKIFNKHYDSDYEYSCEITNISNKDFKTKQKTFIKMAPLLEPYKYLFGKYSKIDDVNLFNLPTHANENVHEKIRDENNSSYVDGFFCYLSSKLLNNHGIINCIDFYGSFIGIKKNYKINIIDDIEYLVESDFFNKNQNQLFQIEDYSHLIYKPKLTPIKMIDDSEVHLEFDELKTDELPRDELTNIYLDTLITEELSDELTEENIKLNNTNLSHTSSLSGSDSSSTLSSRSSHSNENDVMSDCIDNEEKELMSSDTDSNENRSTSDSENDSENDDDSDIEEEMLFATFNEFPVQLIFLECCEGTFDELILNEELDHEEIFSALMQIIMTLIVYQKSFSLTHNDLHTNNIMYVKTQKKYVFYIHNKKIYKVPTFGKIYKIIDFGRAIYKLNGQTICSDSFKNGNDASTQYNIEPYFNDKKPKLEPNFSFDLCRLACSMFDYFIDDISEISDLASCDPIVKLIVEWCLDDKGINILYKNSGVERYPEFKLYKMIARLVHNHTPESQLERDEFKKYLISGKVGSVNYESNIVMNLDELPTYV
jgi:hypothetical protein